MQARVDWALIILRTQVIKKKRPVRPVFPDYLSASYGYGTTNHMLARVAWDKLPEYKEGKFKIFKIREDDLSQKSPERNM